MIGSRSAFQASGKRYRTRGISRRAAQINISWDINGPEYGRVAVGLPPNNPNM